MKAVWPLMAQGFFSLPEGSSRLQHRLLRRRRRAGRGGDSAHFFALRLSGVWGDDDSAARSEHACRGRGTIGTDIGSVASGRAGYLIDPPRAGARSRWESELPVKVGAGANPVGAHLFQCTLPWALGRARGLSSHFWRSRHSTGVKKETEYRYPYTEGEQSSK